MDTEFFIEKAIYAALIAGEKIMEIYTSDDFGVVSKEDLSPLTKADREAHHQIVKTLEDTPFPILSEEGIHLSYADRSLWKTFWLVDPLDGTKEFINRNDEFTVNIALVHENKSIAGVVYSPVFKELYVGIVASGAYKLINPDKDCTIEWLAKHGTKLPQAKTSDEFTVVASRTHLDEKTVAFVEDLKKLHPELKMISRGSSFKICMVAEGIADVYPRFGPTMEWDTAAGHAVAKAAGKNIFLPDLKTELTYNKENLLNPHFIVQ